MHSSFKFLLLALFLFHAFVAIDEVSANPATPLPHTCVTCNKWTKKRDLCDIQAGACKWINKHDAALESALKQRFGTIEKAYKECKGDFGVG